MKAVRHLRKRRGNDGAVQIFHEEGARNQSGDVKRRAAVLHRLLQAKRMTTEFRIRLNRLCARRPGSENRGCARRQFPCAAQQPTVGVGGGTARSCTLRASLAETTTGPVGTNPLNAAPDLASLIRLQVTPFHPALRRNTLYLRFLFRRRRRRQVAQPAAYRGRGGSGCLRFRAGAGSST